MVLGSILIYFNHFTKVKDSFPKSHNQINSVNIAEVIEPVNDPDDVEPTSGEEEYTIDKLLANFYNNDSIWKPMSLSGMNAFNNPSRVKLAEGVLAVAVVSVMGRLTPVCGHKWHQTEADVFCRDAGNQIGKNWNASHVGFIFNNGDTAPSPFLYIPNND